MSSFNDIIFSFSVACEDHSDADCICVVVMTHGHEHGKLAACDRGFEVSDVWSPFTADKCKSLAGKPKLFFIQVSTVHKLIGFLSVCFEQWFPRTTQREILSRA